MSILTHIEEEALHFYLDANLKEDLTDLIVSIIEDYGNFEAVSETPWYKMFFQDVTRSKNIKSFQGVSSGLAEFLISQNQIVANFHGIPVWACEEETPEEAIECLRRDFK